MKASEIKIPECLKLEILSKWLDKEQHKFKLRLVNVDGGQSMDFDYSGGLLAFLPDNFPGKYRAALSGFRQDKTLDGVQVRKCAVKAAHKAAKPSLPDVLHSLLLDSDCGSDSFKAFCGNMGYDEDSRKAYAIWEACQEISGDFKRVAGPLIPELRELLEDY